MSVNVHVAAKTDARRKTARSFSGSRSWLQAMAVEMSRCRNGTSRVVLVRGAA